ncbi:MAG TPA: phenylalanine--tRNA ligase subunit beta [Clostridiales bacterium]|nr:phenylalanine--tRNA ligase subunit beta [Clostridiales bacterium]
MLVPIKWLKEYIDFDLDVDEISEKLIDCGFEVEQIIDQSKQYENILTSKIIEITDHPNASNLKVCKVAVNDGEIKQVITNSKTLNVGDFVFLALDGATLFTGLSIKNTEIRGILSQGMFCGLSELNLTKDDFDYPVDEKEVLKIIDRNIKPGLKCADFLELNDIILDVSITSNRPDANSILGIARELSSLLSKPLKKRDLLQLEKSPNLNYKLEISNKEDSKCLAYYSAIIEDVKILPTPKIIKNKLKSVGIRSINNFVDLTNYILVSIGQPMHAFDYDKIDGQQIIIRNAKEKEKIIALDGKEYTLMKDNLVIANQNEPMAIAGVIGGEKSSVTKNTKTIVLESAAFSKETVRKTSKTLGIRTDSSAQFEKGVNPTTQLQAIEIFLFLVEKYKWGNVKRNYDGFSTNVQKNLQIVFSPKDIAKVLGIYIEQNIIENILKNLNFEILLDDNGIFKVIAPQYRTDIFSVNDIAEEIIRIYGYDKLESDESTRFNLTVGSINEKEKCLNNIRNLAIYNGMHETMTYSFIGENDFNKINLPKTDKLRNGIRLSNPLGVDMSIMRTTLIPSMLNVMEKNFNRSNKSAKFFEISKTYEWENEKELTVKENLMLCLGAYGGVDFYSFKSIIEAIFDKMAINIRFKASQYPFLHPYISADLFIQDADKEIKVGVLGQINNKLTKNYNLLPNSFIAEINLDLVLNNYYGYKGYSTISKYQPVERDFAIVCEKNIPAQAIIDIIEEATQPYTKSINIFDVYQGKQIEENKKSIALRVILQSDTKSLSENDINEITKKVVKNLYEKIQATLR